MNLNTLHLKLQLICLQKAAEHLKQGWCKNRSAINVEGRSTFVDDEDACAWCFTGALRRAATDCRRSHIDAFQDAHDSRDLEHRVFEALCSNIVKTNKEVLAEYRRAAREATGVLRIFNDAGNRTKEEVLGIIASTERQLLAELEGT